ncbi:MAG TPA: hypothetical protein PLG90_04645 [Ignavibacteria bacterium]|nr:hypothetical protein [Ignavibacteria bacterium]
MKKNLKSRIFNTYRITIQSNTNLDSEKKPELYDINIFKRFLEYFEQLDKVERKSDSFSRITAIDQMNSNNKDYFIRFISGEYGIVPPLTEKENLTDRHNPKAMNEFDKYIIHLLIRFKPNNDYAQAVLENRRNILSYTRVRNYFQDHLKKYIINYENTIDPNDITFCFDPTVTDNFLFELDKLSKATKLYMSVDGNVIEDSFYKFSNENQIINGEITLGLKAKRGKGRDFKKAIKKIYSDVKTDQYFHSLKVIGNDDEGGKQIINTENFHKKYYLEYEPNDQDNLITDKAFKYMLYLINGSNNRE